MNEKFIEQCAVTFEDVKVLKATQLLKDKNVWFLVNIQKGKANFIVMLDFSIFNFRSL
jgi:hypothetical protein